MEHWLDIYSDWEINYFELIAKTATIYLVPYYTKFKSENFYPGYFNAEILNCPTLEDQVKIHSFIFAISSFHHRVTNTKKNRQ